MVESLIEDARMTITPKTKSQNGDQLVRGHLKMQHYTDEMIQYKYDLADKTSIEESDES